MEVKHEVARTITEKRVVCTSVYCDDCNKYLYTTIRSGVPIDSHKGLVDYYEITTGRYVWGDRGNNSTERKTVCTDCLMDEVIKFKNRSIGQKNTEYSINVIHNTSCDFGEWTNEEENSYE